MQRICGCLLDWIFLCDLFISAQKAATYQESSQRCTLQFRGINVTCLATTRQNGNLSQAQCLGILWAPEKGAGIFPSKFHGGKKNSHHPQALETFNDSWVSCHASWPILDSKKPRHSLHSGPPLASWYLPTGHRLHDCWPNLGSGSSCHHQWQQIRRWQSMYI